MNSQLSSDQHPGLTRDERHILALVFASWAVIVCLYLCACTIAPKVSQPTQSTGEWLHASTLNGQHGQEATEQAREKWLTLLPLYGQAILPALTPADKDKGWTLLPDGNWFVSDNAVTQYGMMNFYFLNPATKPTP